MQDQTEKVNSPTIHLGQFCLLAQQIPAYLCLKLLFMGKKMTDSLFYSKLNTITYTEANWQIIVKSY